MKKIKNKYLGISAYSLMHERFPVDDFLNAFPKEAMDKQQAFFPATAILWSSFGDKLENVKAFCDKFEDKPHFLEVHLSNECARGRGANEGQIWPRYNVRQYDKLAFENNARVMKAVANRTRNILSALQTVRNANTEVWLSPGLEIKHPSLGALRNLFNCVTSTVEETSYAANVVISYDGNIPSFRYGLEPNGPMPLECHGVTPMMPLFNVKKHYAIYNMDGASLHCGDTEKFMCKVKFKNEYIPSVLQQYAVLLWHAQLQGLSGVMQSSEYTPCKDRNFVLSKKAQAYTRRLLRNLYLKKANVPAVTK